MTNAPSTEISERSLTRDILDAARYYLGGRRTLFVLATVFILGGVALNWGWLVAAGIAPILISFLPCAVMCALGLCMHKKGGAARTGNRGGVANNSIDRESGALDPFDPVSQRMVPAGATIASVHLGQVYYFEDRVNRETFEAAPEKYLAGSQIVGQQAAASNKPSKRSQKGHRCCG
jgi:YHS domain-containing protein